jgi:hypothetical protein
MMVIEILIVWMVGIPALVLTLAGRRARVRGGAPETSLKLDVQRSPLANVIQLRRSAE